jgi:hypothetical protein
MAERPDPRYFALSDTCSGSSSSLAVSSWILYKILSCFCALDI